MSSCFHVSIPLFLHVCNIFLDSLPFPQPFGLDSPFVPCVIDMDINTNPDASGSSSPTQAPIDAFPLTEEQIQTSTLFARPLGPDGSNVIVDLAPGSTTCLDPATLDPALLPGLPRVDNQYNEDYTDYANQLRASNHGDFYVAPPHEEWACRNYGTARYWFYRAWFHYRTIRWDHDDVTNGFFLDTHPYSNWADQHFRAWGTRGWQLVLGATQTSHLAGFMNELFWRRNNA